MNQTLLVYVCVWLCSFHPSKKMFTSTFLSFQGWHGSLSRFPINNYVFVNITQYLSNTSKSVRICGFPFYSFFLSHSLSLFFLHDSFYPGSIFLQAIIRPALSCQPFVTLGEGAWTAWRTPCAFKTGLSLIVHSFPSGCVLMCLYHIFW